MQKSLENDDVIASSVRSLFEAMSSIPWYRDVEYFRNFGQCNVFVAYRVSK